MNFKIIYDNEAESGFQSGWGFSCLVEIKDEKILFDTGWYVKVLIENLGRFGNRPDDIDIVFISHPHWDHIGGLTYLDGVDVELYVPESLSKNLKGELRNYYSLREIGGTERIRKRIWTTGELGNETKEQSLIIETGEGVVVVAGCSHPGVGKILSSASRFGDLYGFVGGMHSFDDYETLNDLSLIVPSHCTEKKDEIIDRFPNSLKGRAGLEMDIP